jgi:hypothetical protein
LRILELGVKANGEFLRAGVQLPAGSVNSSVENGLLDIRDADAVLHQLVSAHLNLNLSNVTALHVGRCNARNLGKPVTQFVID